MTFRIAAPDPALAPAIARKIVTKTKPPGSLGQLEAVAAQIALIQQTLTPALHRPHLLVCAADHGIAAEGVSPYPAEVTAQMVANFATGGAAINVFCRQNGLELWVIDAGVNADLAAVPGLRHRKVRPGTRNFRREPALTAAECQQALAHGAALADEVAAAGGNVVGFGEMGIGNTSAAAVLVHLLAGVPLPECVGRGTGLDAAGLAHKLDVLTAAVAAHPRLDRTDPLAVLATFGGLEIAMLAGAMLRAAERQMVVLVDGFIASAALLVAWRLHPEVLGYCVFCTASAEAGHRHLLAALGAPRPLLDLGLRLGEGTGVALAYPLVQAAVGFLNEMSSFEEAGVSDRAA